MDDRLRIVGIYPISAPEPCHLIEIELGVSQEEFDFGSITQELKDEPRSNWQAAYDEQHIGGDDQCSRWAFFFHYLDFGKPLHTQFGEIKLPNPTPLPDRLGGVDYFPP